MEPHSALHPAPEQSTLLQSFQSRHKQNSSPRTSSSPKLLPSPLRIRIPEAKHATAILHTKFPFTPCAKLPFMPTKATKKSAAKTSKARKLPPPQKLSPAQRTAAIQGVPPAKAKKIAAKEPVSPKLKPGKTQYPLAPERIAAILDAL